MQLLPLNKATLKTIQENVGVVEFNTKARIVQSLTNDYQKCLRAIGEHTIPGNEWSRAIGEHTIPGNEWSRAIGEHTIPGNEWSRA